MKKLFLIGAIIILISIIYAQVPEWLWVVQAMGTSGEDSNAIAVDSQGNQYITGIFFNTVTFGTTTLTYSSVDYADAYVAKLDTNGNWLWAKQIGGIGHDWGFGIAVDNASNVYVTGMFGYGTVTFGTTQLTCSDYGDIFVAKLDTNGNWLWAKQALGSGFDEDGDQGRDIAVDSAANVYITGVIFGLGTFGSITLTTDGGWSSFVAKLDTNGNWLWANYIGGTDYSYDGGIAVDNVDDVYVTGDFLGTANIGPTTLTCSDYFSDIFVAKLDTNGGWLWAKRAGGINGDSGLSISTDSSGNCYVTGGFYGTADFGNTMLTSYGWYDIFAAKLNSSGNWLWAKQAGGTGGDVGFSITVDDTANIYLTGRFYGVAAFGSWSLDSGGNLSSDIFITKLDMNGNWLWVKQAGAYSDDNGHGITVDNSSYVYITGQFQYMAYFGSITLTSSHSENLFVAKLGNEVGNDDETTSEITALSNIYDAYPNPFRSGQTTKIKTFIADRESGNLSVYNLKGQCVASYELNPGMHDISFDSKGLASGVYLYRLKTQSVNEVKKLILIK